MVPSETACWGEKVCYDHGVAEKAPVEPSNAFVLSDVFAPFEEVSIWQSLQFCGQSRRRRLQSPLHREDRVGQDVAQQELAQEERRTRHSDETDAQSLDEVDWHCQRCTLRQSACLPGRAPGRIPGVSAARPTASCTLCSSAAAFGRPISSAGCAEDAESSR